MSLIGAPVDRTDGRLKVTGAARYAAEQALPRMAHAVIVTSTIAHGTISAIDSTAALQMPGVIAVITHLNARRLPSNGGAAEGQPPAGRILNLLQDAHVLYQNQPIAVVVADTLERAIDAARHLRINYQQLAPLVRFDWASQHPATPDKMQGDDPDTRRGNLADGLMIAATRLGVSYSTPVEHHNPMEPHATVASWDGDHLTLYDSTQYVSGVRRTVAAALGIDAEKVRVISPFVGGGFGSKGSTWSHVVLAAMVSQQAGCPVKLVLDRSQMVGPVGARPMTRQDITLGAGADGKLIAMRHQVISSTGLQEDWPEPSAVASRMLYAVPNQETSHRLARMHLGTPTFMRAPGEASGSFALESALDEMAAALKLDPVAMRLQNYAERNPEDDKPWSSKSLRVCYARTAERFGWASRRGAPGTLRKGNTLIGLGMATATYPANRQAASALARLLPDGSAIISSGTPDLGTGTYTVMTQIAAQTLGLPLHKVRFELGDTTLPNAPISGGSQTVASVGPAVQAAALEIRQQLVDLARNDPASPLHLAEPLSMDIVDGWLQHRVDPTLREPITALLARQGGHVLKARVTTKLTADRKVYSMHSFGAVFAEVHVDADIGTIRVARVVAAYGIGKLMNHKTGMNQLVGGIVWGISQALLEKTDYDLRDGRAVNANLGDYYVPVNVDIGAIEVIVVDEDDPHINPLGAKGIGEIGITGVAAAIANAVFNATGKRVRDLPITLDKLL